MSDPLAGLLGPGETHARRPPSRPPQRRKPARFVRLFIAVLVMAALVTGVIFGGKALITNLTASKPKAADYVGGGSGSTVVTITSGQSASVIASTLAKQNVVKTAGAFTEAASADPTRAARIQPGAYLMHLRMSGASAFNRLFDPTAKDQNVFTISEGLDLRHALPIIAKATGLSLASLQAAAAEPKLLGVPSWASNVTTAEGLLFPATYAPRKGTSAVDILRSMVARFNQEVVKLNLVAKAQAHGITPLQAVTLASIVEREANSKLDYGKTATVFYNRLHDTSDFPTLGSDATVRYALGDYTGPLTQSQLQVNSPYNTRLYPGIPPGPIGNPGEATLTAVLNPPAGNWTYFVYLPKENQVYYTGSAAEFNVLSQRLQAEGGD